MNHALVAALSGFELTTTLLFAVVPELFYNYGHKNVSLSIKPLTGTTVDWSNTQRQTIVKATALAGWLVHEGSDNSELDMSSPIVTAFESIMDLEIRLSIDVNATKNLNVSIDSITLNGFNVTLDNLGGSVKSDEANILYRLGSTMIFIEAAINHVISSHPIKLPEFQVFDYNVVFDY